jgi:ABC-2 type transport system permease protein
MEGFKAVFINEIEKLYRKKKAVVIVLISLFAIVLGQLTVLGVRGQFGLGVAGGTEFPLLVLSLFNNTVLPLFAVLVAIDIFSGEFSHNTMKIAFIRPVTRLKIFTAKIAAVAFFVGVNLLTVMILSTLAGVIFNPSSASIGAVFRIIVSYLVTLLPIMVWVLLVVLLTNIFRSGTSVFFLTLLAFIASMVLGIIYSRFSNLFITPMFNWYVIWIGSSVPVFSMLRQFFILLGYGIMFLTAGYYLFDKKDL